MKYKTKSLNRIKTKQLNCNTIIKLQQQKLERLIICYGVMTLTNYFWCNLNLSIL